MGYLLFGNVEGIAHRVQRANPGRMTSISTSPDFSSAADVLITSIQVGHKVKMAVFSTLGDAVYIYPLGNDASQCVISGIALPAHDTCSQGGRNDYSAAKKIIDFYEQNRASNFQRLAKPITIAMPPVSFQGFISGMDMQVSSSKESFGFVNFSIHMTILPDSNSASTNSGSLGSSSSGSGSSGTTLPVSGLPSLPTFVNTAIPGYQIDFN